MAYYDPEALVLLVPVSEVLDIIQRSLVLIGNTNNLVSETRREIVLDAIHSSLKKYAKGDFKEASSNLFGEILRTSWSKTWKQTVPYQKL